MSAIHPGSEAMGGGLEAVGRHMRIHGLWSFWLVILSQKSVAMFCPCPLSYTMIVFFWDSSSLLQEIVPILVPEADMELRHKHHMSLATVIGSGMSIQHVPC